MLEIDRNIIKITKGDSASISVDLTDATGDVYDMDSGDTLTMSVRKRISDEVIMTVTSTSTTLSLRPSDTSSLEVGGCFYDIQLETATGAIYTVVGPTSAANPNMIVYPEVTSNA